MLKDVSLNLSNDDCNTRTPSTCFIHASPSLGSLVTPLSLIHFPFLFEKYSISLTFRDLGHP